jgi:hypothetical protein
MFNFGRLYSLVFAITEKYSPKEFLQTQSILILDKEESLYSGKSHFYNIVEFLAWKLYFASLLLSSKSVNNFSASLVKESK